MRSSFHRYCPASPQNSHLQLSGIFFWEPRFPKNQKWEIFSWSGSIASNLIIYKISKEIPRTLASNQNASAKKSLPSSDADMAGNKKRNHLNLNQNSSPAEFLSVLQCRVRVGSRCLAACSPPTHRVCNDGVLHQSGTLIFYNVKLHCNAHIHTTSKTSGSIS